MADLIKIKGGNGSVPELQDRELGYRKDEEALYIGAGNGNVRLCGAGDKKELRDYIDAYITNINSKLDATDLLIIELNTMRVALEKTVAALETKVATLEEAVATINSRLDDMTTPDE